MVWTRSTALLSTIAWQPSQPRCAGIRHGRARGRHSIDLPFLARHGAASPLRNAWSASGSGCVPGGRKCALPLSERKERLREMMPAVDCRVLFLDSIAERDDTGPLLNQCP